MWYAALLRLHPRHESAISIFIAAIEVMTEPSTAVAMPIAAVTSLPTPLVIIVAIVVVLFIMVFTDVMTEHRAAHRWRSRRVRRDLDPIDFASRLTRRYVCALLITAAADRGGATPGGFTSPACRLFSLCLPLLSVAIDRMIDRVNMRSHAYRAMYRILDIGLK
jgi:hypothetical protein